MNQILSYIHPEGWRFFGIFSAITLFFYIFSTFLGEVFFILSIWCLYFFRDPKRVTPTDKNLVISPADGVVTLIKEVIPPKEFGLSDEAVYRVSVFLNVFDVHVNRTPVQGKIERIIYYPGKFLNASLDKASEHNERNAMIIEMSDNKKVGVVQIAGLIARRIVSFVSQGDELTVGQRFGLIRFGSRVDVYLPHGIYPKVILGQRMIAGESVIANLEGPQSMCEGVKQ